MLREVLAVDDPACHEPLVVEQGFRWAHCNPSTGQVRCCVCVCYVLTLVQCTQDSELAYYRASHQLMAAELVVLEGDGDVDRAASRLRPVVVHVLVFLRADQG